MQLLKEAGRVLGDFAATSASATSAASSLPQSDEQTTADPPSAGSARVETTYTATAALPPSCPGVVLSPTAFRQHAHAQLQPAASQAVGSDSGPDAARNSSANGFVWSQYQLAEVTWQIYKYAKARELRLTDIAFAAVWDAQTAPGDHLTVVKNKLMMHGPHPCEYFDADLEVVVTACTTNLTPSALLSS